MKSLEEVEQELISMGFVEERSSVFVSNDDMPNQMSYHKLYIRSNSSVRSYEYPHHRILKSIDFYFNDGCYRLSYMHNAMTSDDTGCPCYEFRYFLEDSGFWELIPDTDDIASMIVLYGK